MKNRKKSISNKEYIKSLFDEDGIKVPETLSEEMMFEMIKRADADDCDTIKSASEGSLNSIKTNFKKNDHKEKSFKKKKSHSKIMRQAALAACVIVAIVGITSLYNSGLLAPNTEAKNGELYTFKSKSEIRQLMNKLDPGLAFDSLRIKNNSIDYATEEALEYSTSGKDMIGAAGGGHSETYLQDEDVDEADIVKVDGKYIYAVSNRQEVYILETANGKTRKVSTIGNTGVENYIEEIFLKGDVLVTIGKVYGDDDDEECIAIVTYDIKDRSKPRLISQFRQSGSKVVASRMVGNYVYLVTNTYVCGRDNIVPFCTTGGEYRALPVSDISCVPHPQHSSYIILSAVDISSGDTVNGRTKAVFGATEEIYCNDHALYCALSEWNKKNDSEYTRIVKADLDGLDIRFSATGLVRGRINNQFSMDEHDGCFRIATTSQRNGMDVNNLFVLGSDLKEVGKVTGFARNESIKAVRFIGSMAYVITYEAIDPLFIINIADPENPKIEGEVKIDGFSTLLVPISEGTLLGIGHATGDNGYGGEFDSGLKLALFDISKPSEPKVLDSKEFENMNSPAQETHLAFTVNESSGYMSIPYNIFDYGDMFTTEDIIGDEEGSVRDTEVKEPESEDGVLLFGTSADKKKIEIYDKHITGIGQNLRCPYIGDYIYAVNDRGEAEGFKYAK